MYKKFLQTYNTKYQLSLVMGLSLLIFTPNAEAVRCWASDGAGGPARFAPGSMRFCIYGTWDELGAPTKTLHVTTSYLSSPSQEVNIPISTAEQLTIGNWLKRDAAKCTSFWFILENDSSPGKKWAKTYSFGREVITAKIRGGGLETFS